MALCGKRSKIYRGLFFLTLNNFFHIRFALYFFIALDVLRVSWEGEDRTMFLDGALVISEHDALVAVRAMEQKPLSLVLSYFQAAGIDLG